MCTQQGGNLNYTIGEAASYSFYQALTGKYRVLHYSGDVDAVISSLGTYNWIQSLNF